MTFLTDDSNDTPSHRVVDAVAAADGVDPGELEPPLGDVIDADALNRLFTGTEIRASRVSFDYRGYDVTVHSSGYVSLE